MIHKNETDQPLDWQSKINIEAKKLETYVWEHPWHITALVTVFVVIVCFGFIIFDWSHGPTDFEIQVDGDLDQDLYGKGSILLGGSHPGNGSVLYLQVRDNSSVELLLPESPRKGTHDLQSDFQLGQDYGIEVTLIDEDGIQYEFGPENLIWGQITIKHLPASCSDNDTHGEFEAKLSKTARFGTRKRTVEIELHGEFDFSGPVYFDEHQDYTRCDGGWPL